MEQEPFPEELCDGYAALLLSAPCGYVFRRRVADTPSGVVDRQGVFCPALSAQQVVTRR